MVKEYNKFGYISGSTLKIIACILMTIDHVGLELLNDYQPFRIIGRLAFPMFAFFIAEGCKYTNNKLKRFLMIFSIGAIYMALYYVCFNSVYGNIFMTFSVSILFIYLLDFLKIQIFVNKSIFKSIFAFLFFIFAILSAYTLFKIVTFEYDFWGMLIPVCVSLFNFRKIDMPQKIALLDSHSVRIILLTLSLIPLSVFGRLNDIQFYCLLSVIPLIFYNGKQGNKRLKYGFYLFYPVHLVIIELISILISQF